MKSKMLVVLGLVLVITGCWQRKPLPTPTLSNPVPVLPKKVNLTQADNKSSVVVAVGGDIIVTLTENPARNGKWLPSDTFLKLTDESKRTTSDTVQDRKFTYHAHNAGQGILQFTYKEGNTVVDSVSFNVEIR